MYLFVGLGNPGTEYENTPHNAGFYYIDALREYFGWDAIYSVSDWEREKVFECDMSVARSNNEPKILFVKPTTFMNLSGRAVKRLVDKFKIDVPSEFVLFHDDLDIKLGEYKIQRAKRPKDHKGVNSVENLLGNMDFLRVRIGVDNREPGSRISGEEYVIRKMEDLEVITLHESFVDFAKQFRSVLEV